MLYLCSEKPRTGVSENLKKSRKNQINLHFQIMKKVILAVLVAFTSMAASAQVWMGGSLGLDFKKPEGGKTETSLTVSPEVGYTLSDKWDIAIAINENYVSCDGESANSISVEPYARYTFAKAGIASFFVDGGVSIGSVEYSDGNWYDESVMAYTIGFRPGVKLAISEKVCFVTKLGFLGYQKVEDSYENYGFNVNNNALSFGMYWSF